MSASSKFMNHAQEFLVLASTTAYASGKYSSLGSLATAVINYPPDLVFKWQASKPIIGLQPTINPFLQPSKHMYNFSKYGTPQIKSISAAKSPSLKVCTFISMVLPGLAPQLFTILSKLIVLLCVSPINIFSCLLPSPAGFSRSYV